MSYKTQKIKRLSSAALLSLVIYGSSMTPVWAKDLPNTANQAFQKIERQYSRSKNKDAVIGRGKVDGVNENSIVVTRDKGGQITVLIDERTKIFRRYEGKGSLKEIKIGHEVNVVGKMEGDGTTMRALMIRDLSIEKRFGEFKGTVKSLSGQIIILKSKGRGDVRVDLTGARILDKRGKEVTVSSIQPGYVVKAKGVWDSSDNTMTEVEAVKVYSV